jgi:hypothetical protein
MAERRFGFVSTLDLLSEGARCGGIVHCSIVRAPLGCGTAAEKVN